MTWTGYPPDPTTDGWHWLREEGSGFPFPLLWDRYQQTWHEGALTSRMSVTPERLSSDFYVRRIEYVGPCVMP